jgi:hypothetical protein
MRLIAMSMVAVLGVYGSACSYPKEKIREFQKEIARQAAEPKNPEERCQRQGGILHNEQCYTPSAAALDERTCRLRAGLYLNDRCLIAPQTGAAAR